MKKIDDVKIIYRLKSKLTSKNFNRGKVGLTINQVKLVYQKLSYTSKNKPFLVKRTGQLWYFYLQIFNLQTFWMHPFCA